MAPSDPQPHSLSPRAMTLVGWGSLVVAGAIFFALALDVGTHSTMVLTDARVAAWLHENASLELVAFLYAITQLNSTVGLSIMTVILMGVLARMKEWYWLLSVFLAVPGGLALNIALKEAYERARPHFDDPFVTLHSYSFPSGHTAGATAFYGVLAAFLVSRTWEPRKRATIVAGAFTAVALVAFSRMYLGAHYLSDVVAAAASTAAWLALCLSVVHQLVKERVRARRSRRKLV